MLWKEASRRWFQPATTMWVCKLRWISPDLLPTFSRLESFDWLTDSPCSQPMIYYHFLSSSLYWLWAVPRWVSTLQSNTNSHLLNANWVDTSFSYIPPWQDHLRIFLALYTPSSRAWSSLLAFSAARDTFISRLSTLYMVRDLDSPT